MKKTIVLIITLIIVFNASLAWAEPTGNQNTFFPQDVTIKGIFGGHNIFFFVDEHWAPKEGCYLNLIFSQSEIKKYQNSTLTVYLNDIPIKSISLQDKDNYKTEEKIVLPKEYIVHGYNLVKLSTYHRITQEPCTDDLNPANWLVFHKESFVHLEYQEIPDKLGLKDYPYPYLKPSASVPVNCVILIPDHPTSGQMSAAAILATDFGRRVPYNDVDVKVLPYKDFSTLTESTNLIVIGSPRDADHLLFKPLNSDLPDLTDKAMITETISPQGQSNRALYIMSLDDDKLIMAAKALTWDKLVAQMSGRTQFIKQDYVPRDNEEKSPAKVTLKDLGYGDTLLRGIFFQQATFAVNIPPNHRLKEGSFIHLPIRYSQALDFNKSAVSIYLNHIPITDKLLDKERAENDELEIDIPREFWNENSLELKLIFYLEPYGFDCTNWRHGDIWALVSKEASFDIPQEIIKDRYFQHYPGMFIKNGAPDDILLVLPDQVTGDYLTMAANLMAFMGHSTQKIDNIKVIRSSDFEVANKNQNIIVLGTFHDNSTIRKLNDKLYLKFNEAGNKFESNDKLYLVDDYSKNLSSIQLLPSPFASDRHLMVVTGTTKRDLMAAKEYLKDPSFTARLVGDAVVIDNDGDAQGAYFVEPKVDHVLSKELRSQRLAARWQDNPQLIMYIVFFFMLIITGIYAVIVVMKEK